MATKKSEADYGLISDDEDILLERNKTVRAIKKLLKEDPGSRELIVAITEALLNPAAAAWTNVPNRATMTVTQRKVLRALEDLNSEMGWDEPPRVVRPKFRSFVSNVIESHKYFGP